MPTNRVLLTVEGLTKSFRGLTAVRDYTLKLAAGQILGLIGPNGAGKTTVFNLITGYVRPTSGSIEFDGRQISRFPPERIARAGIARTFQNIRLFPTMTVLDNVKSAQQLHQPETLLTTLVTAPTFLKAERSLVERSLEHLALFDLERFADTPATALSYGYQRRLEIARALALRPKLLLLDEPTAGMNPNESMEVLHLIRQVRDRYQLTIILVEHNMPVVMQLCDRIQVLSYGEVIAEGAPEQVRADSRVIEAYLGRSETHADA